MSPRLRRLTTALQRAHAGSALIAVTLVVMAAVALFSWWQLTRAADARRRASDDAIREYAAYSARMFAEGAYRAFEVIRLRALMPVIAARARSGDALPSFPSFTSGAMAVLERSGIGPGDSGVGTFVAWPSRAAVRGSGAMAERNVASRVLRALGGSGSTPSVFGVAPVRFTVIEEASLSVAFVPVGRGGTDSVFYGFTVDRKVWWTAVGDEVTRHLPLLPATFVDPTWRFLTDAQRLDTLIAISVRDGAGRVQYASRAAFPGGRTGAFDALNTPAAVHVTASLHPAMEQLLRRETGQIETVGPVLRLAGPAGKAWQLPLTALLPVLSLVFVCVAAAQLWRQRSVARARRDFVAAVSHELRTPLSQMRLYLETLQLGRSDDEAEARRWLAIVAREARKLGGIVDNILAFAHLDAGRARLERTPTDIGELVEEVVEGFASLAAAHGMRLLADAPSRILADADPRALRQVVFNLIDNAIRFGPAGQTVSVDVELLGRFVRISVSDQGPGIPSRQAQAIWQPFQSTRVGGGTGIGLAVARGLVLAHGGRISVGAARGGGACFTVELPAATPDRRGGAAVPDETNARRAGSARRVRWAGRSEAAGLPAILVAVTVMSLVTTGALRYAWVTQQEATDRAIREYAAFGARLFYDRAFGIYESLRLSALGPAEHVVPGDEPPALASVAGAARSALAAAGLSAATPVGFFRIDFASGAYEGTGIAADQALGPPVRGAVDEAERLAVPPDEPVRWMALLDRDPPLTIGYVIRDDGRRRDAYGLIAPRRDIWEVAGRAILRDLQLLPPSMTEARWRWLVDAPRSADVAAVSLTDPDGRAFFSSGPAFAGSPVGEFDTRNIPGGALVSVTLHPDLVARLRDRFNAPQRAVMYLAIPGIAEAPRLDLLLAVLSLLLLGAVIFQLRKERSLADARRDFVASVSHELRTPLAHMRMFTETLQLGRARDAEERARWLGVVSRETRRLGDLVENILLFSHLGADASRLEKERTDLGELVEDVVEACRPVAAQRGMTILADAPAGIFVLVDPRAMRQVVVNLLDNALKYGPAGQTVRVGIAPVGGMAELSVQDQGSGIPRHERHRIWEPFVRLGRYAGTTAGSGIGLAVVRGLVERHGGSIRIEDVVEGGARFVLTLAISESAAGLPLRATGEWRRPSARGDVKRADGTD